MKSFYLWLIIALLAIFIVTHETQAQEVNLLSPVDGSQVTVNDLGRVYFNFLLSGYEVDYYSIQVATDPDFDTSSIVETDWVVHSGNKMFYLEKRVRYYWRVKARYRTTPSSDYIYTDWSVVNDFIVIVPRLLSPHDDAINQIQPLVLDWLPIIEGLIIGAGHQLWVDDNLDFSSPEIDIKTIGSQRTVTGLDYNTKYYWKVRYYAKTVTHPQYTIYYDWSATREFTTCNIPATPTLHLPNSSATVSQPVTITWSAINTADEYNIQITETPGFSSNVVDEVVGSANYSATGLEDGTQYYWRVRAGNECGWGYFSLDRVFTTECTVPDPPILLLPADGAMDVSQPVTWDWSDVSEATKYHIEIDNDNSDFNSVVVYNDSRIFSYLTYGGLMDATDYWWRVRSGNDCGWGDWSDPRVFTTDQQTDVQEIASDELPDQFLLSQNYPNPFNPTTDIRFELPRGSLVKLEVLNMIGQLVATLNDKYLSAGPHTITWDARNNASGVYLYRLTTDEFVETKKMILLK